MTKLRLSVLFAAVLLVPAGMAMADTPDRAAYRPLDGKRVEATSVEETERRSVSGGGLARFVLPAALPEDVDTDRDGQISFEELALHDLRTDF